MSKHTYHDDAKLIDKNGGVSAIAEMTGYSIQRVWNWRVRGIPPEEKIKYAHIFLPDLVAGLASAEHKSDGSVHDEQERR